MKSLLPCLICLLTAATALAERARFEIVTRYEGFDPKLLAEAKPANSQLERPDATLAAPRVTVLDGQKATVEIIREEPISLGLDHKINSGITLEVEPTLKDGQIYLTGSSTIRHRLNPSDKPLGDAAELPYSTVLPAQAVGSGNRQPLDAVSFAVRETYFSGEVMDGKPYVMQVGDGANDPSKVTLTVTRLRPQIIDEKKHAGLPNYRVYAIEPSPEDAKKPFFQGLGLVPPAQGSEHQPAYLDKALRESPLVIAGVFGPDEAGSGLAEARRLVKDSLKEIPAGEAPIKLSSVLGPDGQTLDVKIELVRKDARKITTDVSIFWGSDIFLALADAEAPGGRRGLLIRQE